MNPGRQVRRSPRAGFTLVEVAAAALLLLVAVSGLAGSVLAVVELGRANDEAALADAAARDTAEELANVPFAQIFARFNAEPADDPDGIGTAPGAAFDVRGLTPRAGDADGRVGRIVFPVDPADPGILREDVVDEDLGMPRDLNGDAGFSSAVFDALDHSGDYRLLPVTVRVEWTGVSGDQFLEIHQLLVP